MADLAVAAPVRDDGFKPETDDLEEGELLEEPQAFKPPSEIKKHPLEHSWTFWFDTLSSKSKQQTWGTSLRSVYTFSSVEDFWGLYNNMLPPSRLIAGVDFHCFKEGIEPKWEDPKCAHGGRWSVTITRGGKGLMDTFWLHTLLAMIGEQFAEGDEVCGAALSVRNRLEKLAIWTKTASNEAAQVSIGKQWKEVLDYKEKLGYIVHEDAKILDKSAKIRYTV